MSDKKEQSRGNETTGQPSKATITRRESLKRIAVTAYAAPATMVLLSSKRAVAQSDNCACDLEAGINLLDNDFDATVSWFDCSSNLFQHHLQVTGPGLLGPGQSGGEWAGAAAPPTGSHTWTDQTPNGTFQELSTYTFTLELRDSSLNAIRTCTDTVTTGERPD